MLFSALVTASLYCLLAGTEMSWKYSSASALLAGLAYLTRYNGIFILAAPALILFSNHLQLSWKRRFVAATLFGVLFFICIAPWGLYCLKEKGSFFYSANRLNIAFDIYGKNQMSREEFFWKGNPFENGSGVIRSASVLRHTREEFFRPWIKDLRIPARVASDRSRLGWRHAASD